MQRQSKLKDNYIKRQKEQQKTKEQSKSEQIKRNKKNRDNISKRRKERELKKQNLNARKSGFSHSCDKSLDNSKAFNIGFFLRPLLFLWYNPLYGISSTNIFYIFNVYSNEESFYTTWNICSYKG